ncbi:MAG: tetratricopeptide repeat protein [Chloroflexota bacterium]
MTGLPAGTVTLLFTDIEGSTRLLIRLGSAYPAVLEQHRQLLSAAIEGAGGRVLDTQGDACFAVFVRASEAVAAAAEMQRSLAAHPWPDGVSVKVRLGMHTGEPTVTPAGYAGLDVHRAARICSAGHGGQILVSSTTADLVSASLPDGLSLTELGSYRFKDFAFAERVYQIDVAGLPTGFPPLRTLEVGSRLPGQHHSLIGRERELASARRLLLDPFTRLLTFTGPGGSGKTRLAVAVAEVAHDAFEDGVCFVPLASVGDAAQVASSIAHALGVRDISNRDPRDIVVDVLGGRDQLVVLDNFEQVLDAAPLVADLLTACPRLRFLATSRELLHLTGERELPVPPLDLPPPDLNTPSQIFEMAAPKLFVERAGEAKRDFVAADADAPVIAEICRRLDGLPLAIELAAARIRFLTPAVLLSRLDRRLAVLTGGPRDLPARQQTLRATIAWSHDLLDERDRAVFRRASVFVNGWTLDAAEAICGVDDDPLGAIDALSSLVDKSLLRREELADGEPRFSMLETIRELALEHLEAAGELEQTRGRHAEYFLRFAEEAEPHLALDASQLDWIERLDGEAANLQAAFDWSQSASDDASAEIGLRLSAALCHYWAVRSSANEARVRIAAIVRLAEMSQPSPAQAKALHGASILARELSDYDAAERLLHRSLGIAREVDELRLVADVLTSLGWLNVLRGRTTAARALFEESLSLFQRLADAPWKARVLSRLGYVAFMEGDFSRALALAGEAATIARVIGDLRVLADALVYLGLAQQYNGEYDQSRRRYEECLPIARRFGDRHLIAMTLNMIGQLAALQGDHDEARRSLRESLMVAREVGNVRRLSFAMAAVATLAKARGDFELAVRLDAASQAAAESVGTVRASPARAITVAEIEQARRALGPSEAVLAEEAGREMTVDQAVDTALEWLEHDLELEDAASAARWQKSPWAVFGWSDSPSESGADDVTRQVPRLQAGEETTGRATALPFDEEVTGRATVLPPGGRVFGEGGALPPR